MSNNHSLVDDDNNMTTFKNDFFTDDLYINRNNNNISLDNSISSLNNNIKYLEVEIEPEINITNSNNEEMNMYKKSNDYKNSLCETETKHSMLSKNCNSNCTKNNNINEHENIFSIYKTPKVTQIIRKKVENAKITNTSITENNFYIINKKVHKSKNVLTQEEKRMIKKIQNRISAQKSRDEQKSLIVRLKNTNRKLKQEVNDLQEKIIKQEKEIKQLKDIMSTCQSCNQAYTSLNENTIYIQQETIFHYNNPNVSFSSLCGNVFTVLITLICVIGMFSGFILYWKVNRNGNRLLTEKIYPDMNDNNINSTRGIYFYKKQNLHIDYEYYGVNYCHNESNKTIITPNNPEIGNICEDFLEARITKEMNFKSIYEDKEQCFNFRMIIPCENSNDNNNITTNSNINQPIIALENSEHYRNTLTNFKSRPYYEMHCKIYQVNRYDNAQCSNDFNH